MSLKASEVLDGGEVLLWERHTTKSTKPDGSLELVLADGVMPDGKPCRATLAPGWKPKQAIMVWSEHVKGEYNAREAKQEAAAIKRAEASRVRGERTDAAPVFHGGSEVATPEVVQDRQASVEAILESKVADIGRSLALVETQITATMGVLESLQREFTELKKERHKVIAAMKALREVS